MTRLLRGFDRILSRVEGVVVLACIAVALAIGTAQVVLRYVFNTGYHWSEVMFVFITVTGMLFAGSMAVREDRHVRVDVVSMLLPRFGKLATRFLADLVALALCGYFVYCGVRYVLFLKLMGTLSPETGIPDWIFYLLVPVTFSLFVLRYLQSLRRTASGTLPVAHGSDPTHLGGGT